jgi:hypothetical protein
MSDPKVRPVEGHVFRRQIGGNMRKTFLLAAAAFAATLATPALADKPINPPTLHGFCSLGDVCTDNGTNTPTDVNPPVFSFASSGGSATGDLWIDILVPNNGAPPASFTISGPLVGAMTFTASLFSSTAWTSGQLDTYLSSPASPANPIGAFLPATQVYQPTATGFYVYQADLGTVTLLGTSGVGGAGQDNYLLQLGQSVVAGTYIVGFLDQGGDSNSATANSGAILETRPPLPEPATWAMMLMGFGATGVALRRTRRKNAKLAQIA